MNNGKQEWTIKVNDNLMEFEVECYPPNDSKRRYMLKIYPKDKTLTKREILVIMLNPSSANEFKKDQTCEFVISILLEDKLRNLMSL